MDTIIRKLAKLGFKDVGVRFNASSSQFECYFKTKKEINPIVGAQITKCMIEKNMLGVFIKIDTDKLHNFLFYN